MKNKKNIKITTGFIFTALLGTLVFTNFSNYQNELKEENKTQSFVGSLEEEEISYQIEAGGDHTGLLTDDGRVFMWGNNEYGQLGNGELLGEETHEALPVETTSWFTDEEGDQVDLTGGQISLGMDHSGLVTADGRLFMWGNNEYGQLGNGEKNNENMPIEIDTGFDGVVQELHLGYYHSTATLLKPNGGIDLLVWGQNDKGQLGLGHFNDKDIPRKAIELPNDLDLTNAQFSMGTKHSIVLSENGRVFAWGRNDEGQVTGDSEDGAQEFPIEITNKFKDSDGSQLNLRESKISTRGHHSSLLTGNGQMFTWGNDGHGQLGKGELESENGFYNITENFNDGDSISLEDAEISMGQDHSSLLTVDGKMFTWGRNGNGQLGNPDSGGYLDEPHLINEYFVFDGETVDLTGSHMFLGTNNSYLVDGYGELWGWGSNNYGKLGHGEEKVGSSQKTPLEHPFGKIEDLDVGLYASNEDNALSMKVNFDFVESEFFTDSVQYRIIENGEELNWVEYEVTTGANEITISNLVYTTEYGFEIKINEEPWVEEGDVILGETIIDDLDFKLEWLTLIVNFNFTSNISNANKVEYRLIENGIELDWVKRNVEEGFNELIIIDLNYSSEYMIEIKTPGFEDVQGSDKFLTEEKKGESLSPFSWMIIVSIAVMGVSFIFIMAYKYI